MPRVRDRMGLLELRGGCGRFGRARQRGSLPSARDKVEVERAGRSWS